MSWSLEEDPAPQPPSPPSEGLAHIVLTAALTAAATGLVAWGIEELRGRLGSKSKDSEVTESKTCSECAKKLEKEGWRKT